MADAEAIRWAPKVRQSLVRRLYERDAKGIVDEDLIDKVGYGLLARCETIRRVTRRLCPTCGGPLRGAHDGAAGRERSIVCESCGWTATWGRYHRSYKKRRIHGGRAFSAFLDFLQRFPNARDPRERMFAIDGLIHAVHQAENNVWTTPAASNLIEGKATDVLRFLDGLAYGDCSTPGLQAVHREWRRRIEASEQATRNFYAERGKDDDPGHVYVARWEEPAEERAAAAPEAVPPPEL